MNITGIVLIFGIALFIWGYNIYGSAGSQVSQTLSGDTPIEAWAGMISGAIFVATGVLKLS